MSMGTIGSLIVSCIAVYEPYLFILLSSVAILRSLDVGLPFLFDTTALTPFIYGKDFLVSSISTDNA